jgi:CPA1 family monovalent cation:H+ antiporter
MNIVKAIQAAGADTAAKASEGAIGAAAFQRLEQELDWEELDLQQLAPGADSGRAS